MKQRRMWLLILLSILTLILAPTFACAEDAATKGHVEVGISGMDVDDNPARIDEYVKTESDNDSTVTPKIDLSLEHFDKDVAVDVDADFEGSDNFDLSLGADIKRIIRLKLDYQSLQHRKDHETLGQMGATARDDIDRSQPAVVTDEILANLEDAGLDISSFVPGAAYDATPDGGVGGGTIDYDPRAAFEQELANDYIVTRKELESEVDMVIPALPNIVFHAGMRIETRQGLEQAIGLQKCDSCHVSATGKTIDERTEDFTFGATGKFGFFTVDYEYMNRTFSEDGATPVRYYEDASNGNAYQLLYENGEYPFARTPDSEKDSHMLKVRADLPRNTSLSASYVKADIESSKTETQDEYQLTNDTLATEFESFGGKLATKFGNLRLSLRANTYEIEADTNDVYYPARDDVTQFPGYSVDNSHSTDAWHSAEARKVSEFGIDAVYRLSTATTARLGYELEVVDRDEEELNETKTQTLKVSLKSRINKQLSGRLSYQYQNIDDPLAGADVGIAQFATADGAIEGLEGSGLWFFNTADFSSPTWYWSAVYPNRTLESTSLPENVHEAKINTTWSPKANLAATFFARVRLEENDNVNYEKETYVPGMTLWYAPNSKMNLTMAYTFNKMQTENRMCVGWYHG